MLTDETNTLAVEPETTIAPQAPETEPNQEDGPVSLDSNDEANTQASAENEDAGVQEDDNAEPAPQVATIEYDGVQYEVPEKLKDAFLRQQDYTRKTQEVADIRKEAEAIKAQAESYSQASQEELQARVAAMNLEAQIKQYESLDWPALLREDPMGAQEHRWNFEELQKQRQQIGQYLQNAEQQRSVTAQQETAKRLQETRAFAEKEIPGWTPDLDAQITKVATTELGFSEDTLRQAYNPQIYRTLYLANIGLQTLQRGAAKPVQIAAKPQPLQRVSAKSNTPVAKNPENMSMDEYAAWRSKQR